MSLKPALRSFRRASGRPFGLQQRMSASAPRDGAPLQPVKNIESKRAKVSAQAVRWVTVMRAPRGKGRGAHIGCLQQSLNLQRTNSQLPRQKSNVQHARDEARACGESQGTAEKKIHGRRAAGERAGVIARDGGKGRPRQQSARLMGGPQGGRRAAFVRKGRIKHLIWAG